MTHFEKLLFCSRGNLSNKKYKSKLQVLQNVYIFLLTVGQQRAHRKLTLTNTRKNQNFSHLHKQLQVNVPHVTPVDCFAANKFSKQQHLQALKPERPLQFFTKSLAIVTMSFTY